MELYVTVKYEFYPDHPYPELSEEVEDIEIGVFRTSEAAKRSIEEQYAREQRKDDPGLDEEDLAGIEWHDREDGSSWTNDYGGEVLVRKMTLE